MKNKFLSQILIVALLNMSIASTAAYPGDNVLDRAKNSVLKRINISHNKTGWFKGKGVTIKFRSTTPSKPILMVSPPSVSMSCAGVSMKSMWGKLINMDDFEAMLKDAGASLSFGIMLGLQYTMPDISAVFKSINDFARKIQKMLQNACQTGMQLGQHLKGKGNLDLGLAKAITNASEGAAKYIDKAREGDNAFTKLLGMGLFDDDGKWKTSEGTSVTPAERLERIAILLRGKILKSESVGAALFLHYYKILLNTQSDKRPRNGTDIINKINSVFKKAKAKKQALPHIKMCFTASNSSYVMPVSSTDQNEKYTNFSTNALLASNNPDINQYDQFAWLGYAIAYSLVGDIGISNLDEALSSPAATEDVTNTANGKKVISALSREKNGGYIKTTSVPVGGLRKSVSGLKIANFLLTGNMESPVFDSDKTDDKEVTVDLKVPCFDIIRVRGQGMNNNMLIYPALSSKAPEVYYFYDESLATGKVGFENRPFKGSKFAAKCLIDKAFNGSQDKGCDTALALPSSERYIKIVQDTPVLEQSDLKEKLIDIIAFRTAEGFLLSMMANLDKINSSDIKPTGGKKDKPNEQAEPEKNNISSTPEKGSGVLQSRYYDSMAKAIKEARTELMKGCGFENANALSLLEGKFAKQAEINRRRALGVLK